MEFCKSGLMAVIDDFEICERYILSIFDKIEIFASYNRRFNKLSNDTRFIKIEVKVLKIQVLQSGNYF